MNTLSPTLRSVLLEHNVLQQLESYFTANPSVFEEIGGDLSLLTRSMLVPFFKHFQAVLLLNRLKRCDLAQASEEEYDPKYAVEDYEEPKEPDMAPNPTSVSSPTSSLTLSETKSFSCQFCHRKFSAFNYITTDGEIRIWVAGLDTIEATITMFRLHDTTAWQVEKQYVKSQSDYSTVSRPNLHTRDSHDCGCMNHFRSYHVH